MSEQLLRLANPDLLELSKALRAQRLGPPYTALAVERVVDAHNAVDTAAGLRQLAEEGHSPAMLATILDLLAKSRQQHAVAEDIDLVTTGPEAPGITNRDTSVVVRELFAHAQRSVLLAGYAISQGRRVFEALAQRMEEVPDIKAIMFLDISRNPGDTSAASEIVCRFAERFRAIHWPANHKLPELYFDPRGLKSERQERAILHAKCVVVDRKQVFVSSANFTEAAQEKNIEVGLLIQSPSLAQRICIHFETLVEHHFLERVF